MEKIMQLLLEAEEQAIIDNIDQYEFLIEHTIEEPGEVLRRFVQNYKPTYVHSVISFGGYESEEALALIQRLGDEMVYKLILKNLYIKQDNDIYREHWNDIGYCDCTEYETQIDIEEGHENYKDFKGSIHDKRYGISFHGLVNLGMVRYKLNTEDFEAELLKEYGIDVSEITFDELEDLRV